jgi:hypothetical protein
MYRRPPLTWMLAYASGVRSVSVTRPRSTRSDGFGSASGIDSDTIRKSRDTELLRGRTTVAESSRNPVARRLNVNVDPGVPDKRNKPSESVRTE